MLQLLTCSKGHSWEAAADDGAAVGRAVCPVCGDAVELLPLIDLAPSPDAITATPEPIQPQAPPIRDAAGKPVVAGFEILEEIGRSSLGVRLFKAKQVLVNRLVLLKVVVARDDAGQLGWGALRGEAAALGRLTHPNATPLLEAGERERQLFYNAVEWVEGPTLAEHAGGSPMPPQLAIRLVEVLARAVHSAHEQGVVHRCLRPACIRLQPLPERGNRRNPAAVEPPFYLVGGKARCLPRIGDFGLARRPVEGDPADVELYEDMPTGLSPEQAWGRAREIGPCSDIYALGAILYELLSGRPPFRGRTSGETLDFIRTGDPPYLYGRVPGLSSDMALVCRKAMQRNPRNRYDSALAFAEDLRALVENRPIKAWKKGAFGRLFLWVRRRPMAAALLLVCLLAPIAVLIAYAFGAADASTAKEEADKAKTAASAAENTKQGLQNAVAEANKREQRSAYYLRILQANREFLAGNFDRRRRLLQECPVELRQWEWHYLDTTRFPEDFQSLRGPEQPVRAVAYSPDGRFLAVSSGPQPNNFDALAKREVRIWQPQAPGNDQVLSGFTGPIRQIAFSVDGKRLATASSASNDFGAVSGQMKEWDAVSAQVLDTWGLGHGPADLAYSADGKRLVWVDDQASVQYSLVGSGKSATLVNMRLGGWGDPPRLALLNPDATKVAVVAGDADVQIYDPHPPGGVMRAAHHTAAIGALTFSPATNLLASGDANGAVIVWDVQTNQAKCTLAAHNSAITGLSFTRDGARLATSGADGDVRIWDPATGQEVLQLTPFARDAPDGNAVAAVQFNPGKDKWQLAAAHGTEVRLFDPAHP